jgi:hypothetical protein
MSTRSWSKFMPGMIMVIFLGPLKPSTFVSCETQITMHAYMDFISNTNMYISMEKRKV